MYTSKHNFCGYRVDKIQLIRRSKDKTTWPYLTSTRLPIKTHMPRPLCHCSFRATLDKREHSTAERCLDILLVCVRCSLSCAKPTVVYLVRYGNNHYTILCYTHIWRLRIRGGLRSAEGTEFYAVLSCSLERPVSLNSPGLTRCARARRHSGHNYNKQRFSILQQSTEWQIINDWLKFASYALCICAPRATVHQINCKA